MHKFKFTPDDLFVNRLKTYPEYNVFIYQGLMYVNKETQINGQGGIPVYDINRTRGADKVKPYVLTGSAKVAFKSQQYQPLVQNHSGDFQWTSAYVSGAIRPEPTQRIEPKFPDYSLLSTLATTIHNIGGAITSSYSNESPITRRLTNNTNQFSGQYYNIVNSSLVASQGTILFTRPTNLTASALQNVARKYTVLSPHFIFSGSTDTERSYIDQFLGGRNLLHDAGGINFIFIPNMYYGSTIKKGSIELNYYLTGSKIASCADVNHNGTLVGTSGNTSGSVVGIVMYDEGIIALTSSTVLETGPSPNIEYLSTGAERSSWIHYGTTLNDNRELHHTLASASYDLNFKGTNYVNSMTMFAHARKGHLNHSNNPSYRNLETIRVNETGSGPFFAEGASDIVNIVSGSHISASFDKTTYISKVHIYDEDGNLIGITSLAKPVKKTLTDEFTFKMKLDL